MNTNTLSLRSVLEKDKLNGTNFLDWYRNLMIVLKQERKLYVLEQPIPEAPAANATRKEKDAYKNHQDNALDVSCIMLATMNSELQKQHENMDAYGMVEHLKQLYQGQARHERFEALKSLPEGYSQFVLNYNMNEIDKPLPEMLSMLRTAEANLKKTKTSTVLMVNKGKGKWKPKGKGKTQAKGKANLL
ncbi:uncharacterized protein LOC141829140 [Curcuma longa]|uniref:uncharacterized protein LOC141829140 n=1 Tax=Curcuma longa TaxID=136217 RepID=UPI003D9ED000